MTLTSDSLIKGDEERGRGENKIKISAPYKINAGTATAYYITIR